MKAFLIFEFCLCAVWSQAQDRPTGRATATVHIVAVDVYGSPVTPLWIDGFKGADGKEWAGKFRKDGTADAIPYGEYELEAASSTRPPCRAKAQVFSVNVWVTAAFEAEPIEAGRRLTTEVSGHINGMPKAPAHCVLSGVYFDLRYEADVDPLVAIFDFGYVVPGARLAGE